MAVRLIISITATAGKGAALARAMAPRLTEVQREPGCLQYDLFQNIQQPDKLVLLERWSDEASLQAHAELNRSRPPLGAELRAGPSTQERFLVD